MGINILVWKPEGKETFGSHIPRGWYCIKGDCRDIGIQKVDRILLTAPLSTEHP
jgi:hypothetical protein